MKYARSNSSREPLSASLVNAVKPFGSPKEEDDSIVSSFDFGGLAKMFLGHRHPAAGIANIAQL